MAAAAAAVVVLLLLLMVMRSDEVMMLEAIVMADVDVGVNGNGDDCDFAGPRHRRERPVLLAKLPPCVRGGAGVTTARNC